MKYNVSEIGKAYVVVNGQRIEVDPPFEVVPDIEEYQRWLEETMENALEAVRGRGEIQNIKDHLAQVD